MSLYICPICRASLVAHLVKNLPAVQETQVWSLGWKDFLEREMAIYSVFSPRESHGQRSLVDHSPWGRKEWDMTEQLTNTFTSLSPHPEHQDLFAPPSLPCHLVIPWRWLHLNACVSSSEAPRRRGLFAGDCTVSNLENRNFAGCVFLLLSPSRRLTLHLG